ncbi:MAG: hypothetical protein LRY68_07320 [Sulfurospirillum sp.]|nr:hypothetical protein [Sulfurospirillum sp.]
MGKKEKKKKIVDQHEENLSIKELEKEEKVQVWVKKKVKLSMKKNSNTSKLNF